MVYRWSSMCGPLLLAVVAGCYAGEKTPAFTWTGRWEKTELQGSYHSYIKLEDGRIACFQNWGIRIPGTALFHAALAVSFTREPGNLFTWTPFAPVMTVEGVLDLPDPADPKKPAPDRVMTRPTVVKLPGGTFLGLGLIGRDYPPVDGLYYVVSYSGSAERLNVVREALLAGRDAPKSAMWEYHGKVKGPVGEYQDKVQIPNSMYTDVGNLIFLPDGPAKPDHARPTRNRFLLFANYLGAPELKKDGWEWTVLCYSADGRAWFFAKDAAGAVRNVTPFRDGEGGYIFPFVFRHAADEWWMWRSSEFHDGERRDTSLGAHEIYLYYSDDGLNWRLVRKDADCKDFPGTDGKPLGLKTMAIYYDAETKQIHGMLSVRDETGKTWWRKYHNIAKVTGKQAKPLMCPVSRSGARRNRKAIPHLGVNCRLDALPPPVPFVRRAAGQCTASTRAIHRDSSLKSIKTSGCGRSVPRAPGRFLPESSGRSGSSDLPPSAHQTDGRGTSLV